MGFTSDIPEKLRHQLRHRLRDARHLAVFTGAGISAESGVPTFRDALTGLWARYDPADLATPQAFERDPRLVWEWYASRRELVAQVAPNAGHQAIMTLERQAPHFDLITQNVDGLHQRAGSSRVIELHGNLTRIKCAEENTPVALETIRQSEMKEIPPRCPRCGGLLRPDVVWFGESLPADAMEQAATAVRECDVLLSIGTSSLVYPAAELPFMALDKGAVVIEINPVETPLTPHVQFALHGLAGEILPELVL
ncbi:MAG: NAD-dependent deacylase [Gammaproteobacteria bacterium]|nr:NAD-dependent deacylase [Gammaproteobacteria bacterium]